MTDLTVDHSREVSDRTQQHCTAGRADSEVLYKARELSFHYHLGTQHIPALEAVTLSLRRGHFYCLSGPSGSGKTTLLNLLGLVEPVQAGELSMQGRELDQLSERAKNQIRRFEIGFVFQSCLLFPMLTAIENVEYFLARQGIEPRARRERAGAALADVGIAEQSHKKPLEMSGGQRQRVAIARALAKRPRVVLADEPTASLDQKTGHGIVQLLARLNATQGITVIVSSHDPMVQNSGAERIVLCDGRVESQEPTSC